MLASGSFTAKIAALAILLALLLAANQFALQPLLKVYRDNRTEIASSHELLQRYQALAAEKPELINRLASLESGVETSVAYLEGASDALATAALQDRVVDAIEMAGADIRSIRSLPAVDVDSRPDLQKTGVQLLFAGDIDSLAEALHDLETMDLHLSVNRLEVRAKAGGQRKTMRRPHRSSMFASTSTALRAYRNEHGQRPHWLIELCTDVDMSATARHAAEKNLLLSRRTGLMRWVSASSTRAPYSGWWHLWV